MKRQPTILALPFLVLCVLIGCGSGNDPSNCESLYWGKLPIEVRVVDLTTNLRKDFNQLERVETVLDDYNEVFGIELFQISEDPKAVLIEIIDDDMNHRAFGQTTRRFTGACRITSASVQLECDPVNCGNSRLTDTAAHEFGHLLGSDHISGTFMDTVYHNDRRTPAEQILDEPFYSWVIDTYGLEDNDR